MNLHELCLIGQGICYGIIIDSIYIVIFGKIKNKKSK